MVRVPAPGIELIKKFEGSHLAAYPDPLTKGRPYTIGWGSTRRKDGRPFELGEQITAQEAEDLLIWQIEQDYLPPQERIPGWASFNDNQRGAVLSFAYNLGARFYGSSGFETLSRTLRNQDWAQIEYAFVLYRNPGTNVEEGLLRRRLTEADVFLTGMPGLGLSAAGRTYLNVGRRTYSGNSNISNEARTYLASRSGSGTVAPSGGTGSTPTTGSSTGKGPAPATVNRRTLFLTTPNMQGDDVLEAQRALVRKGAGVVADGVFGPATRTAVERFQQVNGLVADGAVGPVTWARLLERVLYLANPPMTGDDVVRVQRALTSQGYNLTADGVFGSATEQAIRQFQSRQGLVADGVAGPLTLARLGLR
ncbi:MAG: peptidoglycan-binding protein [Cyanobacteria bacterium Co-bin8]|nr:peptidoglycan-binding protein [Cyanobacteria bacterium Co-bin8]